MSSTTYDSPVRILWTGGFDSTYRMVELSRQDVTVQPVYCTNPERDSAAMEKETIEKILTALKSRDETSARFLPILYIDRSAIPENQAITEAYRKITKTHQLGAQYEWLARLAAVYPGLEIGIEKANHEKTVGGRASILKFGKLLTRDGITFLDKENSTAECALVMGNFRFPIIHLTEDDMLTQLQQWGYEDILRMIWFCHEPLDGKPCGMCRACQQKMESSMTFLLSSKARRRYQVFCAVRKCFGNWVAVRTARYLLRRIMR